MFRFAEESDRENLLSLWKKCFGDDEKYVYLFLDTFLEKDNVYIFESDGKAVSVVYSLDCEIDGMKSAYFYAVATDENYRRQGLAKREIEFLIDYKTKKGTEIFLLTPSNEKNRAYYKSLGFEDFFYAEKRAFEISEEKTEITENVSCEEIFSVRESVFGKNHFVSFPVKHLSFAVEMSDKVFAEKSDGKIVSYAITSGKEITELCCEKGRRAFVSAVLEKIGTEKAEIYIPTDENTAYDSCKIPRGMVYCSNKTLRKKLSENTFLSLNLE